MSKPIEQTLAEYLLNLSRGSWTKDYNRRCLAMWRETYGETVAARVEKIVREKWGEK